MQYPFPNHSSEQPVLWMWGSHSADNLYLWLSDLTPWKVLFLSDVSMQGEVNRETGDNNLGNVVWKLETQIENACSL